MNKKTIFIDRPDRIVRIQVEYDRFPNVLITPMTKAQKPDIAKNRLEESNVIQDMFSEWFRLGTDLSFQEYILTQKA